MGILGVVMVFRSRKANFSKIARTDLPAIRAQIPATRAQIRATVRKPKNHYNPKSPKHLLTALVQDSQPCLEAGVLETGLSGILCIWGVAIVRECPGFCKASVQMDETLAGLTALEELLQNR